MRLSLTARGRDRARLPVLVGLLAAYAFRDGPQRLIRAHRGGRVLDRARYHAVNAASVLVLSAWLVAVVLGVDERLLGDRLPPIARLTGVGLAVVGLALAATAPLVHAIAVLEEAHLEAELGEAYRAYLERVPRWVPGS